MSNMSPDAGIPLLTEVLADSTSVTLPLMLPPTFTPPPPIPEPSTPPLANHHIEPLTAFEDDLIQRVLQRVSERLNPLIEQRVRDTMADVLQLSVDSLATEIREGLQYALRDVVTRAVADEIAHHQKHE